MGTVSSDDLHDVSLNQSFPVETIKDCCNWLDRNHKIIINVLSTRWIDTTLTTIWIFTVIGLKRWLKCVGPKFCLEPKFRFGRDKSCKTLLWIYGSHEWPHSPSYYISTNYSFWSSKRDFRTRKACLNVSFQVVTIFSKYFLPFV